jgi:PAS domain S-box-containing protein
MLQDMINEAAYMAHGYCLLWKPWLIALHAISDVLIFASYFAIPSAIWVFLRKRTDLELKPLAVLFAGFIFLCGLTHAVQFVTLWWPIYETQGFVKVATAIVSLTTAIAIFPLIPKAIAIPSPRQLQLANNGLALEIASHRGTLAALEKAKDELEMRAAADRNRSGQALRASEQNLRLALDAAELGTWRWEAGTKEIQWDGRCRALFGVPPDARVTYETWANCIVAEDRARTEANVARALDPGDPHDETACEFRVRHPDGSVRWLSSIGRAYFEPDLESRSGRRVTFKAGAIRDVTDVRLAEAALRASEERFRGIFEHAGTGIAITDLEGRFQSCNPAYSTMLGYSKEELRELTVADIQHPDDRAATIEEVRQLTEEKIPSFEIVSCLLGKDGRSIWVHKYVSVLRDDSGRFTNVLVLVTNITERKRQDDQIRLLMHEVNHRSKNMLSLVQAIARQTLAANPEDFLDRFGKRVQALATSQDLLVKNTWKGADLDELVRSHLAHFEDSIGTRIELQGPPLFVSAPAAQVIGMALHELATNAGKYGALSGGNGRVEIAWCIQRDERDKGTFVMSWREQCVNPITPPTKQGFGSSVIGSMVEMSLGAKVELGFPATGLTWQLRCPSGEVLEGSISSVPLRESERPASNHARTDQHSRILVVEDEALVAIEIAHALTEAGFDVVGAARSVPAALELLKGSGCDAAVLDVNLGSETSEAIAVELTARGTPFVALSGYASDQYPSVFADAPALTKPLRPEFLIAELRKCLEQKARGSVGRAQSSARWRAIL